MPSARLAVRRPRVVLVEDDHALRTLLSRVLRADGYDVVESTNGTWLCTQLAARFKAPDVAPVGDLIVTDVRMPELDGFDVLALARRLPDPPPIAVVTGFGDERIRARALAMGAAVVFEKPLDLDDLRMAVMNLLSGRHPGLRLRGD